MIALKRFVNIVSKSLEGVKRAVMLEELEELESCWGVDWERDAVNSSSSAMKLYFKLE